VLIVIKRALTRAITRSISSAFAVRRGGAAPLVFPLDEAGALPQAAYGNARLTSAYSGPCWRVVRPSDSAELDIGFSGQWVDEAALSAFLGTETGRLRTWYDLTGNGLHMDQATAGLRAYVKPGLGVGGAVSPVFMATSEYALPAGISLDRRSAEYCGVLENPLAKQQWAPFEIGAVSNAHMNIFGQAAGGMQCRPSVTFVPKTQTKPTWFNLQGSVVNATLTQDTETATGAAPASLVSTGGVFGRIIPAGYGMRGMIPFSAFYGRVLSTLERDALRAACDSLWACVSTGGVLILNGDSIMASSTAATLFDGINHRLLPLLSNKPKVFNFAGGGEYLQNDVVGGSSNFTTDEGAVLSRYTSDRRVVFVFKGTNDMSLGGRTPAQVYADLQSYCASVRSGGGLAIVATLLPKTGYGLSSSTDFDALNANIRANWASFADGFVDYATHSIMGAAGAASDTSLYLDGLHPTPYGNSLLAAAAAPEINRVFALP
jgi:lysophospholipase L1-like esterase